MSEKLVKHCAITRGRRKKDINGFLKDESDDPVTMKFDPFIIRVPPKILNIGEKNLNPSFIYLFFHQISIQ